MQIVAPTTALIGMRFKSAIDGGAAFSGGVHAKLNEQSTYPTPIDAKLFQGSLNTKLKNRETFVIANAMPWRRGWSGNGIRRKATILITHTAQTSDWVPKSGHAWELSAKARALRY